MTMTPISDLFRLDSSGGNIAAREQSAPPRFMQTEFPLSETEPRKAYLFPVNAVVSSPDGPTETWVYRVAALSSEEARNIVWQAASSGDLTITRILVLPALPGAYEFVASRVMQ